MAFEVTQQDVDGKLTLTINGNIDEDAVFPEIQLSGGDVYIDMSNVKAVNSVGIRSWLKWITPLSEANQFIFKNCPKSVVLQMNMVEGFLPKTSRVESLFVPFYSEDQDEEKDAHFFVGKDVVVDGGNLVVNFDSSSLGGEDWEMDVNENKYFKFLKPE